MKHDLPFLIPNLPEDLVDEDEQMERYRDTTLLEIALGNITPDRIKDFKPYDAFEGVDTELREGEDPKAKARALWKIYSRDARDMGESFNASSYAMFIKRYMRDWGFCYCGSRLTEGLSQCRPCLDKTASYYHRGKKSKPGK